MITLKVLYKNLGKNKSLVRQLGTRYARKAAFWQSFGPQMALVKTTLIKEQFLGMVIPTKDLFQ